MIEIVNTQTIKSILLASILLCSVPIAIRIIDNLTSYVKNTDNHTLSIIETTVYISMLIIMVLMIRTIFEKIIIHDLIRTSSYSLIGPLIGVTSLYLKPTVIHYLL